MMIGPPASSQPILSNGSCFPEARRWGPSAEVKADVEAQRRSARRSGGRAGRAGRSGEVRSFDSVPPGGHLRTWT